MTTNNIVWLSDVITNITERQRIERLKEMFEASTFHMISVKAGATPRYMMEDHAKEMGLEYQYIRENHCFFTDDDATFSQAMMTLEGAVGWMKSEGAR